MKAITREEKIISGENLTPITRKEMFLAKAAGMDIETPEPITREEMFLSKIGGSGGGDNAVIDVAELPTENIEEGKIYRVIEKQEMAMWIAGSMGEDQLSMAFPEFIEWAFGMTLATPTHVVEVLPDVMDAVDRDNASYPVYIVESTGIGYCSFDGTSSDIITFGGLLEGLSDNGWVDSVDDIDMSTPLGVFFIRPKSSTTYGIPNAHPVKRFVDGAWVELA